MNLNTNFALFIFFIIFLLPLSINQYVLSSGTNAIISFPYSGIINFMTLIVIIPLLYYILKGFAYSGNIRILFMLLAIFFISTSHILLGFLNFPLGIEPQFIIQFNVISIFVSSLLIFISSVLVVLSIISPSKKLKSDKLKISGIMFGLFALLFVIVISFISFYTTLTLQSEYSQFLFRFLIGGLSASLFLISILLYVRSFFNKENKVLFWFITGFIFVLMSEITSIFFQTQINDFFFWFGNLYRVAAFVAFVEGIRESYV